MKNITNKKYHAKNQSIFLMTMIYIKQVILKVAYLLKLIDRRQEGSTTIVGMLICLMIGSTILYDILKLYQIEKSIFNRSQLYLCFKYLDINTESYIENIVLGNYSIQAINISAIINPATSNASRALIQQAQQIAHYSYLKKMISNNYCSTLQATFFIKNTPYSTNAIGILRRNKFGVTITRQNIWNIFILGQEQKTLLKGVYYLDGPYSHLEKEHFQDLMKEDLLNFPALFGLQLFHL
jgi:hypothetical protein